MKPLLIVIVAALLAANPLAGCARSAANMAATQPERKDLSVIKKGTPRDVVVARIGAPETTTQNGEFTAEVYKFTQGYSAASRTARVFAHSTLSVATLGLWEVTGTAIEGYARGNTVGLRIIYDRHGLIFSYEVLEGDDVLDDEIVKGATKVAGKSQST